MDDTVYYWGAFGAVAGILVAAAFFLLALWLVARARAGNRRVREAHSDPHVATSPRGGAPAEDAELARQDRRDISQ